MKPIFLPLKREYYDAFEDGSKTHEFRLYGPRWNEKNCQIGREVVLSCGYGKQRRMKGRVFSFDRVKASSLPPMTQKNIKALYGPGDHDIAKIGIVRRVQLRRRKGWKMPANTVKADRSTRWGNPFVVGQHGTQDTCVTNHGRLLAGYVCLGPCAPPVDEQKAHRKHVAEYIRDLHGKNIACWCPLDAPCHADNLLIRAIVKGMYQ